MDKFLVLRWCATPSACPKTSPVLPPATPCWGRRGYGSACTRWVPKSRFNPTHQIMGIQAQSISSQEKRGPHWNQD